METESELSARVMELEDQVAALVLQQNHLLAHVMRTGSLAHRLGYHYVEDAVAEVFGVDWWDFYGGLPGHRPPKDVPVLARRTLYNQLHTFLGRSIGEICRHYDISKDSVRRAYRDKTLRGYGDWTRLDERLDTLTAAQRRQYWQCLHGVRAGLAEDYRLDGLHDRRMVKLLTALNTLFSDPHVLAELTYADNRAHADLD